MINPTEDMKPKRKIGRPKGSKNKKTLARDKKLPPETVDIKKITLQVPRLPLTWQARKMNWQLKQIERNLKKDPLFISAREYFYLVKEMKEVYDKLHKEGLETSAKRKAANRRTYTEDVDQIWDTSPEATVGDGESAGVDNGVSASNPFGRQGGSTVSPVLEPTELASGSEPSSADEQD